AEISASFQSFDPTSLSQAPRDPNVADAYRTMTTPPRPVSPPPLDARAYVHAAADGVIPPIPPIPPMPGEDPVAVELERRAAAKGMAFPDQTRGVNASSKDRWPTILTAGLVAVGATVIMSLLAHPQREEGPIALGFYLIGGTIGAMLVHFKILARQAVRNPFTDRLLYAAGGFVCALPGLVIGSEHDGS